MLTRRLHLSKGQLVDIEGRLQTRQWDDDAGVRHWKTEVVVNELEMLSGRRKKEYERETVAETSDGTAPTPERPEGTSPQEALVAM